MRDASIEWDYHRVSIASATTTLTVFGSPALFKGVYINSATNAAIEIYDGSSPVLTIPIAASGDTFDFQGVRVLNSLAYDVTAASGCFTLLYRPLEY